MNMDKTKEITENKNELEIVSNETLNGKTTVVAISKGGDLVVKVETHGKIVDHNAKHLVGLWNGFQKLPHHLKLSASMVFQMLILADEQDLTEPNRLLKEEIISLKWWNNIYRWGYFVILMGLITYALIKH